MWNASTLLFIALCWVGCSVGQATSGTYAILLSEPQQIIKGLGVEIQSDSIGSGNDGLPEKVVCVPHDLVPSEKMRFYKEMLTGFRYLRLAMGLFLRGTDSSQQHIVQRYPGQMEGLYNLTHFSGMEGIDVEYWSPAPYWKSTGQYINGSLKSFDTTFLTEFGDALIEDIEYLISNNLSVVMWGLQNEPPVGPNKCIYSCCGYSSEQYYQTFKVVAPKLKAKYPDLFIHVDSWGGQESQVQIVNDSSLLPFVDAWTWHKIGADSNMQIQDADEFNSNTQGKPVFSNEFEYLNSNASDLNCLNTAQSIMNWFTFENSPTWFWLHALKPTYNSEASGYSLGFWRPWDDNDTSPDHFPNLEKGCWEFNYQNWYSIAGFLKYMGWNAQRYLVKESEIQFDQRILAFRTSDGHLVFVLTNRANYPYTFNISVDLLSGNTTFEGHLYTPSQGDISLGFLELGPKTLVSREVQYLSIEFWVQQ
eukprot:Phypoly_transcript_07897.p1 GENE.Phypoly_transcript_07897~~Phypoly_transcript_07897.p1  ORF type:complete len:476 (+),score=41.81 Phypoly_transcript_07897:46-1473(+)